MTTPNETFIQKLEQFAGTLSEEEREVLGEILLHSMQEGPVDDSQGHVLSASQGNLLGAALFNAQSQNKTLTQVFVTRGPLGQINLAAAGPVAGSRFLAR